MRMKLGLLVTLATFSGGITGSFAASAPAAAAPVKVPDIVVARQASGLEQFAAREIRRYLYLRAGGLATLRAADHVDRGASDDLIVVLRHDRPLAKELVTAPAARLSLLTLGGEDYWLKTLQVGDRRVWLVTGGSDVATLYAAYGLAERMGVRFFLHGDVIPDERLALPLPVLDERHMPLFALRGIQPFHDFPEGPDWWNRDDYLAVMAQLPKLRLNFFGLHTYPEGHPNAEPTVWIGRAGEADSWGRVRASYPASYQNTLRGSSGYAPRKTRDYHFGAGQLFARDAYGNDVMEGFCPWPTTDEAANEVFNRAAAVLSDAFAYAHELGVKTCVGTETPLTIPARVRERLKAAGQDPAAGETVRRLYEGIFQRIARAYPVDYYWLWTPESWTWKGTTREQVWATLADIGLAATALRRSEVPFQLATCGWVLGPEGDRAKLGRALPPGVAVSCINRQVGMEPVDPAFREVTGRGKWAIPWLEDDPALTAPQLWVGRMRRDAADARLYGCTGLMGIHWRTRAVAPNVAALADAAWDQSSWNEQPLLPRRESPKAGPQGGRYARFPDHEIAGTDEDPVYRTVRYQVSAYHLPVANGSCRVTLKFCEPHYQKAGQRVFGVRVQGRTVIERLDIVARAGRDHALDFTFDNLPVTNGWVTIEFAPIVEFPSIAGLIVAPAGGRPWKINCGGEAWRDYLPDWPEAPVAEERFVAAGDFYLDWAAHAFGSDVAPRVAALLTAQDCRLPRPAEWVHGPGGIRPDTRPWEVVRHDYDFVERLETLADQVRGAGNRARYAYWLNTFQYLRAMARLRCEWAEFNTALRRARAADDPATRQTLARERVLPLRVALVKQLGRVYRHLLATVSTPGELGTLANWEQHILPGLIEQPGAELAKLLGDKLPPAARPASFYRGPSRLIVPTARASYSPGEPLTLTVLLLSEQMPRGGRLYWRKLGRGGFQSLPLEHVTRGVYRVRFPLLATAGGDLEYYVRMTDFRGEKLRWPATAPRINHTLVCMPRPGR